MAGDCHTIAAEPRKLPSLLDLADEFNRIKGLIGVLRMTVRFGPPDEDANALDEFYAVIAERCEAFETKLAAVVAKTGGKA